MAIAFGVISQKLLYKPEPKKVEFCQLLYSGGPDQNDIVLFVRSESYVHCHDVITSWEMQIMVSTLVNRLSSESVKTHAASAPRQRFCGGRLED